MKCLGRIILLIAGAGILQTALAVTDAEASHACIAATATSSADQSDCSRADSTDNNTRPQPRFFSSRDNPPGPKGIAAGIPGFPLPPRQPADGTIGSDAAVASAAPVYLLTRRLRI